MSVYLNQSHLEAIMMDGWGGSRYSPAHGVKIPQTIQTWPQLFLA